MSAKPPVGERWKAVKAAAKAAAKKSDDQEKTSEVDGEAGLTENEIRKKCVNSELSQHRSTSESAKKEEQNQLAALFKLCTRVELSRQTRFSSVMAYAQTIQEKEKEDPDDDDN